jgi:HTH-type transcriptional regulator, transcriptional repressor of NAD biosynthesis genes
MLTDVNTPFVQDGARDGALIREWMHETFVTELIAQLRPFFLVSGTLQDRFNSAVECIDEVISEKV